MIFITTKIVKIKDDGNLSPKKFCNFVFIMILNDTNPIVQLNLPRTNLCVERNAAGRLMVYDRWRGRRVILTPEEWVRQNFVAMLVEYKGYVSGRIANEITISLNGTSKRCDTVVYDDAMRPLMIIEYKSPEIKITQSVFDQIARYAIVLRAPYLTVSNGLTHYCCRINYENESYSFLSDIPQYNQIV